MSIPYINIAKAVALRANQIAEAEDAATFEENFANEDLAAVLDGMELPYTALKLAILASEKRIAELIAFSKHAGYRAALYARSADVEEDNLIPTRDENGTEFIGNFSGVIDSFDGTPLTVPERNPVQTVMRWRRNEDNFFVLPAYQYCTVGPRFHATRDTVFFEGCAWDAETQSSWYDNKGDSPLPQAIESFWVADVLSNLPQEKWFVEEAANYRQIATNCETSLKQNMDIGAIALPG